MAKLFHHIKRVSVYYSYAHSRVLASTVAMVVVVMILHLVIFLFMMPLPTPSRNPVLAPLIALTNTLYIFLVVYSLTRFAGDLSEGGAQLFLSYPIGRAEYTLTWLLVSLLAPVLLYALSIIAPLAVLDPHFLLKFSFFEVILVILEMLSIGSLVFFTALAVKSKKAVVVLGILLYFILPYFGLIALSILTFSMRIDIYGTIFYWIYEALFPYKTYLFFYTRIANKALLVYPPLAVSIVSSIMSLLYAKSKLEVT